MSSCHGCLSAARTSSERRRTSVGEEKDLILRVNENITRNQLWIKRGRWRVIYSLEAVGGGGGAGEGEGGALGNGGPGAGRLDG